MEVAETRNLDGDPFPVVLRRRVRYSLILSSTRICSTTMISESGLVPSAICLGPLSFRIFPFPSFRIFRCRWRPPGEAGCVVPRGRAAARQALARLLSWMCKGRDLAWSPGPVRSR